MIHPDTELRPADARVGYGVFATRPIPRGTISWVHDTLDQTFTWDEVESLAPLHRAAVHRFSYLEPRGTYVLCWDHARYNNHSCRPSCRTIGGFDVVVRDLAAGDELTIEYAVVNVQDAFTCVCGEPQCRGTVSSSDADRYADAWDAEARGAVRCMGQVPQPLASLFSESTVLMRAANTAHINEALLLPSCRDLVLRW